MLKGGKKRRPSAIFSGEEKGIQKKERGRRRNTAMGIGSLGIPLTKGIKTTFKRSELA
jgi:hypothetical protein